jgi:uncharacterized protein (TIGR02147 family)
MAYTDTTPVEESSTDSREPVESIEAMDVAENVSAASLGMASPQAPRTGNGISSNEVPVEVMTSLEMDHPTLTEDRRLSPDTSPTPLSMRASHSSSRPPTVAADSPLQAPRLADYTDFRQYLKDVYEFRRETESTGLRAYSYSAFSAAADIRSPNYLKLIIEGRRNLSDDMISRFARALRLNKMETEEFRVLVHYGQATEPIQRNQFLKELADLRAERAFASGAISEQAWEKIPGWMGWVIFAMTDQAGVQFDPEELYRLIRAKTSPDDVKGALRKLMQEGHLVGDSPTQMTKGRDLIESPQDLPVAMIRKLQAELIYLGIESLFRDSPKEREFGAMTMAMTQEEFDHVRFELRQLRKRLQKDLMVRRQSSKGDRVYQLNIQLFPVTDQSGH